MKFQNLHSVLQWLHPRLEAAGTPTVKSRRSRILVPLSLSLLLLSVSAGAVYFVMTGSITVHVWGTVLLFAIIYALGRAGYAGFGSWLLVLSLASFVFVMLPRGPEPILGVVWLVFPMLLSTLVLPLGGATVFVVGCLVVSSAYLFGHADGAWSLAAAPEIILFFAGLTALSTQRAYEQSVKSLESQARELERSTKYWETLVMHAPIGIVTLDTAHNIVSTNPVFEALFGYSGDQIAGRNLDEMIVPSAGQEDAARLTRSVMSGGTVTTSAQRRRSDGSLVDVELAGVPIVTEGESVGALAIYLDISQRKRAERELVKRQSRLEMFNRVAFLVAEMGELQGTMRTITEYARWVTDADIAILAVKDHDSGQIADVFTASSLQGETPSVEDLSRHPVFEAVFQGETVLTEASTRNAEAGVVSPWLCDTLTCMGVPVRYGERVMAAILLMRIEPDRPFTSQDTGMILTLSHLAALALQRSHQFSELDAALAFQRRILETAATAVYTVDADMCITTVNEAFMEITGYAEEEVVGQPFSILRGDPGMSGGDLFTTGRTSPIHHGDCQITTRSGRRLSIIRNANLIHNERGQVVGGIESFADVTDLADARRDAEAASRAKSEFLANMSHELRTPLNAILGFVQLMQRSHNFPVEHQENLRIIGRSGEALLELINDILDMSKIEAGRHTYDPTVFDLHAMLDGVLAMFAVRASAKGLRLVLDRDDGVLRYVETDERKLRQVLVNLLGNAVKFTDQGTVTLSVSAGEVGPGRETASTDGNDHSDTPSCVLNFAVIDTGVGIDPDEMGDLFEAFTQTSSGKRIQEGTGLGLPISRQFVRVLGGELTVHSHLGTGSRFAFAIPVREAVNAGLREEDVYRPVVGLAPGQPVYRILVADDREENRVFLQKLLGEVGFVVRTVENGQEAVDAFEAWHPQLVLMDLRMPVMNGYEATQQIKATLQGQSTVVIALTASALKEDRKTSLAAGCDDFLSKPVRESEIFAALARHLGVRYVVADRDDASGLESAALRERALSNLPAEWREALLGAATRARGDLARDLVAQLDQVDAGLAAVLLGLIDDYQFDRLIALLS